MVTKIECLKCGKKQKARFDGEPVECKSEDCNAHLPCVICHEDSNPAGWFETEDGDIIPCHGCNQAEITARRKQGIK